MSQTGCHVVYASSKRRRETHGRDVFVTNHKWWTVKLGFSFSVAPPHKKLAHIECRMHQTAQIEREKEFKTELTFGEQWCKCSLLYSLTLTFFPLLSLFLLCQFESFLCPMFSLFIYIYIAKCEWGDKVRLNLDAVASDFISIYLAISHIT